MTDWTAFAGFSGVVVLLLLLLAHVSQSLVSEATGGANGRTVPDERDHLDAPTDRGDGAASPDGPSTATPGTVDPSDETVSTDDTVEQPRDGTAPTEPRPESIAPRRFEPSSSGSTARTGSEPGQSRSAPPGSDPSAGDSTDPGPLAPGDTSPTDRQRFSTGELLANVFVTHGLFAALVAGAAVYWEVPASALGISPPTPLDLGWGLAAGLALYAANEVGAAAADRLGVEHAETLRELLAPESPAGWALLLGGALPMVAVGEELIFRGVLVGALAAGFGLPVWGLAVASSVAFALGHGAQGHGGIVVTGLLGFALAAAYVVSGSLLLVIVAHYVVNALEFVVHEGLGFEWTGDAS